MTESIEVNRTAMHRPAGVDRVAPAQRADGANAATRATLAAIAHACTAQVTLETPLGRVLLARTDKGLAGAWFEHQKHHPLPLAAPVRADDALLCDAAARLTAYFDPTAATADTAFDLPLDLLGTPFQRAVWQALRSIPPGGTQSYGRIAAAIGAPSAVRAVGNAVGRNPLSVIVPCHRVIGGDGSMTGYAGGLPRKLALLALERGRVDAATALAPSRA